MNLVLENISISYNADAENLFPTLEIKHKDKVLFQGPSGCGKTTLFRVILGFEKIIDGKLLGDGKEIVDDDFWSIRRKIAYVDQDVSLPLMKTKEWFDFLFSLKTNRPMESWRENLLYWINFFLLKEDVLSKPIDSLSGGEKQRISLISALLLERDFFILDEPTTFLDRELKKKTADLFLNNNSWTVLVASHDEVWHRPGLKVIDLSMGRTHA